MTTFEMFEIRAVYTLGCGEQFSQDGFKTNESLCLIVGDLQLNLYFLLLLGRMHHPWQFFDWNKLTTNWRVTVCYVF